MKNQGGIISQNNKLRLHSIGFSDTETVVDLPLGLFKAFL
jgi:hypothetical protein